MVKGNLIRFKWGMALTLILGIVFLTGQITEYIGLYNKQVTLSKDVLEPVFLRLPVSMVSMYCWG